MFSRGTFANYYHLPEKAFSFFFYKNGCFVASYPWAFIAASVFLFFVTAVGMLRMQTEKPEDMWNIYFPRGKPATEGSRKLKSDFSSHSDNNYWSYQDTGEIVSLNALFLMHNNTPLPQILSNINESCHLVDSFKALIRNEPVSYQQVCAIHHSLDSDCVQPSICSFVQSNTHSLCLREKFLMEAVFPANRVVFKDKEDCFEGKEIVSTAAFRLIWFFQKELKEQRRTSEEWIRQMFEEFYEYKEENFDHPVHLFSMVVQFDEYHSIVETDAPFVAITIIMMTVFSVGVSLKYPGFLQSRSILALAGVVTTCLAVGSTLGFLAFFSVPFIEVAFLTPFIMLGIGIDSTFVLMFTWAKQQQLLQRLLQRTPPCTLSEEERLLFPPREIAGSVNPASQANNLDPPVSHINSNLKYKDVCVEICVGATLRKAMISIFISSLTSFLAFLVGSFTPYEAVNITCYHLAVFTVFLLIYETTFFTASLSLHHRRVIGKYELKQSNTAMGSSLEEQPVGDGALGKCNGPPGVHDGKVGGRFNRLELMVKKWLPKLVLNNAVRLCATAFVILLILISTFQVLLMEEYFNEIEYQPDNSRILDYYYTSQALYNDPVIVSFVIDEKVEYWNETELENLEQVYQDLTKQNFSDGDVNESLVPWFSKLRYWLKSGSEETFYQYLETFQQILSTTPYMNDWIFDKDNKLIKSRFFLALKPIPEKDLERTVEVIETIDSIISKYHHKIYFTSRDLMMWERSSHMRQSIWISILIALAACIGVTAFLLPHPIVFLSVSACGAFTMVCTLGCMALHGIEYSLCTYIIVLLMIGLCIDYISHTGHAYLAEMGHCRKLSTRKSLENIGVPLFNAAMSSIISISMLGFSNSNMMRRLFVSMVLLFGFSFIFGVIFLPIILSVIGPTRKCDKSQSAQPKSATTRPDDKTCPNFPPEDVLSHHTISQNVSDRKPERCVEKSVGHQTEIWTSSVEVSREAPPPKAESTPNGSCNGLQYEIENSLDTSADKEIETSVNLTV